MPCLRSKYAASRLPITFDINQETNQIISKLLWNQSQIVKGKQKRNYPINRELGGGGGKAQDFISMIKANRLSWVKYLLSIWASKGKCKTILADLIHSISLGHFLQMMT